MTLCFNKSKLKKKTVTYWIRFREQSKNTNEKCRSKHEPSMIWEINLEMQYEEKSKVRLRSRNLNDHYKENLIKSRFWSNPEINIWMSYNNLESKLLKHITKSMLVNMTQFDLSKERIKQSWKSLIFEINFKG